MCVVRLPEAFLKPLLAVAYVASLATKLSDTLASEVGKAYGKTCYLSTTLKRVPPGTEGAVSLEGHFSWLRGVRPPAAHAVAVGLTPRQAMAPVIIAAFVAYDAARARLGAGAQGRVPWLTNEVIGVPECADWGRRGAALFESRLFLNPINCRLRRSCLRHASSRGRSYFCAPTTCSTTAFTPSITFWERDLRTTGQDLLSARRIL